MKFLVRCDICGTKEWLKGEDEPDVNACTIDEDLSCGHDDFTIIDGPEHEDWDD